MFESVDPLLAEHRELTRTAGQRRSEKGWHHARGFGQARRVTSAADSRLPRALLPFARRQYRLLASGLILAMFADGVWTIAVIWQIIALGGGPGQVSLATGVDAVVACVGAGRLRLPNIQPAAKPTAGETSARP